MDMYKGCAYTSASTLKLRSLPNRLVLTFDGVSAVSLRWMPDRARSLWKVGTSCPAIRHWPDRARSDWLCALSVATSKSALINAVAARTKVHFFPDMRSVLL